MVGERLGPPVSAAPLADMADPVASPEAAPVPAPEVAQKPKATATALELETVDALTQMLLLAETTRPTITSVTLRFLFAVAQERHASLAVITRQMNCPKPTVYSVAKQWISTGHVRLTSYLEYKVTDSGIELLKGLVNTALSAARRRLEISIDVTRDIIKSREEAAFQKGYKQGVSEGYDQAMADLIAAAEANRRART
jgi:hypothetical protein